jgi:hypothetical protein
MVRWDPGLGLAVRVGLWLAGVGCRDSGDTLAPRRDATPPEITIVQPADGDEVLTTRPSFLIRVSDAGSGVFCSTLEAIIDGADFSQFFLSGCNATTGEVRAAGQIQLEGGANTLVFRIADRAGNVATATRTFTVTPGGGPAPGPGD